LTIQYLEAEQKVLLENYLPFPMPYQHSQHLKVKYSDVSNSVVSRKSKPYSNTQVYITTIRIPVQKT